jgi:hypothetical protein
MTISIVNSYVCMSGCDVAKAKKGQDPHPSIHGANTDGGTQADERGPAVRFGGALVEGLTVNAAKAVDSIGETDATSTRARKLTVGLLA